MQAAASRSSRIQRNRRAPKHGVNPHLAIAGDTGLLDALPIAAAIIVGSVALITTYGAEQTKSSGWS
jgi:hypothetical protein